MASLEIIVCDQIKIQLKMVKNDIEKKESSAIRIDNYKQILVKAKAEFEVIYNQNSTAGSNEGLSDFTFITIVGQGAFGVVKLVKHEPTGKFYAMKILTKEKIIRSKQLSHTINEKRILKSIKYPFLVYLAFWYKDNSYLYFSMPFINGGEMFTQLRKSKKFDENRTRFYAAQVVLAIEYLHFLGMVYRDLKPENIMIDDKGFIKVTDFGFCKRIADRTYTLCGTPEYIAPEIIQAKGYGKSVDWWSFGILVFEMAAGYSPFYAGSSDQMVLLEKIVAGKYKCPSAFSSELKNLVQNILQADLTRRYGNLKNGADDIKQHSWFNSINWMALYNQEVISLFVPEVSGPGDYSQFDTYDDIELKIAESCQYEKEFAEF